MGTQGSGFSGVGKEWAELRMKEAMGALENIALDMRLMQVCGAGSLEEGECPEGPGSSPPHRTFHRRYHLKRTKRTI